MFKVIHLYDKKKKNDPYKVFQKNFIPLLNNLKKKDISNRIRHIDTIQKEATPAKG